MPTIRVNASLLNLRQEPSTDAAVVDKLQRDARAEKLAASADGEWFQVRTAAGTSGWISAKYALEVPAVPPQLETTASLLNLRASADPAGTVVAKLPKGTRVEQTGTSADGAWISVRTADGSAGWISAQYAVPASTTPTPAPSPAPAATPASAGAELPWMAFARGEMGQTEIEGAQNNPRILEYHATTSLRASDDETPWCSAFANWCMKKAGIKGSGEANARSWLTWGRTLDAPVAGCIVVLKRGTSATSGHVGFFLEKQGDRIQVLGGNQSNRVKLSLYPAADVLGYRLPAS